jgi:hypothetical protein
MCVSVREFLRALIMKFHEISLSILYRMYAERCTGPIVIKNSTLFAYMLV